MSERRSKEYDSVDLTEDEDSSEGNSGVESPFHFVDCSSNLNESLSAVSHLPSNLLQTAVVSSLTECSKQTTTLKVIPKLTMQPSSAGIQTTSNKKVQQFTSVQIKPPTNSVPDTPGGAPILESVSLDSDNESAPVNRLPSPPPLLYNPQLLKKTTEITLPKNDTIYSPKQPPGKVVIIKKNNKYYKIIIPHNVMPNISKSMGPVLINIPEVGPLVISNDPQAANEKPNQFQSQQLSLNLDAIDQTEDSAALTARKMKEAIFRDKRFCWSYNSCRKRDLEGFSYSDRLGFTKAETKRAKKCDKAIAVFLTKCEQKLSNTVSEYERFKQSLLKKNKIKLVKINSIIGTSPKSKENKRKMEKFVSNLQLQPKRREPPSQLESDSVNNTSEMDDYGSDLLVTKKIVILDSANQEIGTKIPRRRKSVKKIDKAKRKSVTSLSRSSKIITPKKKNFNIRPCFVQLSKDKRVEEAYRKYCKQMELNFKQKPEKIKLKSYPPKLKPTHKDKSPKHIVMVSHIGIKQTKLFENKNMLLRKVIYSAEKLEDEINTFKPILIVTEQTITTNTTLDYYCNEFSKNNIIYVVNSKNKFPGSILKVEGFISAVEVGYIKLVDVSLFSRFVSNGMKFPDMELSRHCAEHNYSVVRN